MAVTLIVGTQWGDEGKGKLVDYFSKNADYVVRFQGGNNAGHTIQVEETTYKLHLLPSGVIQGKTAVIGNGVVIDPTILTTELEMITSHQLTPSLYISDRAHIIMPYHKLLDGAEERLLADKKIGTTKRGIGPCYSDKIARLGIRAIDLTDKNKLKHRLDLILPIKQRIIDAYGIEEALDHDEILNTYLEYGKQLKPYITDTGHLLREAHVQNKNILLEGAQGTMLDVDYGTYPFTTSSHVISGGGSIGTGLPPTSITNIIGIVKAYTTRVGEGPLPTELHDDVGHYLQQQGHEVGTTTSRPRRCGWIDLVILRHAIALSGITEIALTKLDVLTGLKELKICTHYELNGKNITEPPANIEDLTACKPVYSTISGWETLDMDATSINALPKGAQDYIHTLEQMLKTPITIISIGPKRNQTINLRN